MLALIAYPLAHGGLHTFYHVYRGLVEAGYPLPVAAGIAGVVGGVIWFNSRDDK